MSELIICNPIWNLDWKDAVKEIPDESVDFIISDPPYSFAGMRAEKNYKHEISAKKIDFKSLFNEYYRILKNDRVIAMFMHIGDLLNIYQDIPDSLEYWTDIIWVKPSGTSFLKAKERPLIKHETILLFSKGSPRYNYKEAMDTGMKPYKKSEINSYDKFFDMYRKQEEHYNKGTRYMSDVIFAPNKPAMKKEEKTEHPTQKPLYLVEKLVKAFSIEGELVVDLFAGSGTTGIACLETNRRFIINDISKKYVDLSAKRIDQWMADNGKTKEDFKGIGLWNCDGGI